MTKPAKKVFEVITPNPPIHRYRTSQSSCVYTATTTWINQRDAWAAVWSALRKQL